MGVPFSTGAVFACVCAHAEEWSARPIAPLTSAVAKAVISPVAARGRASCLYCPLPLDGAPNSAGSSPFSTSLSDLYYAGVRLASVYGFAVLRKALQPSEDAFPSFRRGRPRPAERG